MNTLHRFEFNFLIVVMTLTLASTYAKALNSEHPDLQKYSYVDPGNIVPQIPLEKTLLYYDKYYAQIKNKNFITVVDMGQKSSNYRQFVINMNTGQVHPMLVTHGTGSDPKHSGYAQSFSNKNGSNATSLGMYYTAKEYIGKHKRSLRLQGLESTNSNAYSRAIVIHAGWYVSPEIIKQQGKLGRSNGCPAVEQKYLNWLIDSIANGSVYYIWHPSLESKK